MSRFTRDESDTRYQGGVAATYANKMADLFGGTAQEWLEACEEYVKLHSKWHENNRWNFEFKDGFKDDIREIR